MRKTKTTATRRLLLDRYSRVADGIALLFFPYVEIVIHDLHSQTVAYIANNLSKREIDRPRRCEEAVSGLRALFRGVIVEHGCELVQAREVRFGIGRIVDGVAGIQKIRDLEIGAALLRDGIGPLRAGDVPA